VCVYVWIGRSSIDGNRKLGGCHGEEEKDWLHPCTRVCVRLCMCARKRKADSGVAHTESRPHNGGQYPFNYARDSTQRRKQAPSRTGRCAA